LLRNWLIYVFCILLYLLTAITFRYSDAKIAEMTKQIDDIYRTEPVFVYVESKYDTGISLSHAESLCVGSNLECSYYQKNIFTDAHLSMPGHPNYIPPNDKSEFPRFPVVCVTDIQKFISHNDIEIEISGEWHDSSVLISKDLANFNSLSVGDTIRIQYFRQAGKANKECIISGIYDSAVENDLTMYVSLDGFRDFIGNMTALTNSPDIHMVDKAVYKIIDNHVIDEIRVFLDTRTPETYQTNIDDGDFVNHMSALTQQRRQIEVFSLILKIGLLLCTICFTAWILYHACHDIKQFWIIGCKQKETATVFLVRYTTFFIISGSVISIIGYLSLPFMLILLFNYFMVIVSLLFFTALYYRDQTWRKL